MSAFNPLVDGYAAVPDPGPPPTDAYPTAPAAAGGQHVADLQGMPPIFGDHNTPLHVAFLGLLALAVVAGLQLLGFRFSAAAGIGVGR